MKLVLLMLALGLGACNREDQIHVLVGESMGTTYRVKVIAPHFPSSLHSEIQDLLNQLESALSTWRSDTWVSRFNAHESTEPVDVPEIIWPLLIEAQKLSEQSDGRFDITVGPLVERWGFGPASKQDFVPPEADEIEKILVYCGYEKLRLMVDTQQLAKSHSKVRLDMSAIAKGYAVDQIAELLYEANFTNYLVEFGGDLRVRGQPPASEAWRIALPGGEIRSLTRGAVATSGPRHQNRDGYCHLVDPRTGKAVRIEEPVSVVADTCVRADGMATSEAIRLAGSQ